MRNRGYTMIEILIGVAAVSVILLMLIPLIVSNDNTKQAQSLANRAIAHGKIFNKYALDHNDYLLKKINEKSGKPVVIKWSELTSPTTKKEAIYTNGRVPATNQAGQTPCLVAIRNAETHKLQTFMFYGGGNRAVSLIEANTVSAQIGGMAGVYSQQDQLVNGSRGGWQIANDDPLVTAAQTSCRLQGNSVVINLSMFGEYEASVPNDHSLHRVADRTKNPLGAKDNSNTLLTDISLSSRDESSQKIYFGESIGGNAMYLGRESISKNVVLKNGYMVAGKIQPTKEVERGASCTKSQEGAIARAIGDDQFQSQLHCTYNPVLCEGGSNKFCYLPINPLSVYYEIPANKTEFQCPDFDASPAPKIPLKYIDITRSKITIDSSSVSRPTNYNDTRWGQENPNGVCGWELSRYPVHYDFELAKTANNDFSYATKVMGKVIWVPNIPFGRDCNVTTGSRILREFEAQGLNRAVLKGYVLCSEHPSMIEDLKTPPPPPPNETEDGSSPNPKKKELINGAFWDVEQLSLTKYNRVAMSESYGKGHPVAFIIKNNDVQRWRYFDKKTYEQFDLKSLVNYFPHKVFNLTHAASSLNKRAKDSGLVAVISNNISMITGKNTEDDQDSQQIHWYRNEDRAPRRISLLMLAENLDDLSFRSFLIEVYNPPLNALDATNGKIIGYIRVNIGVVNNS